MQPPPPPPPLSHYMHRSAETTRSFLEFLVVRVFVVVVVVILPANVKYTQQALFLFHFTLSNSANSRRWNRLLVLEQRVVLLFVFFVVLLISSSLFVDMFIVPSRPVSLITRKQATQKHESKRVT